ncbi:hypothetical protein ACUZ9N_01470 [Mycoplasmopsis gallinarum]
MQFFTILLLEPIMEIAVVIPEDYFCDVMGDLTHRRGRLQENETRNDGARIIPALVPLS